MHRCVCLKYSTLHIVLTFTLPCLCFSNIGAEWNPTGNPIGGGPGYSDSVHAWDYFVSTKTQLLEALSSANNGDVIYVDDNAEIDLTGAMLYVNYGVTLSIFLNTPCIFYHLHKLA